LRVMYLAYSSVLLALDLERLYNVDLLFFILPVC